MGLVANLKERIFRRGIRRTLKRTRNRLFHRVTVKKLRKAYGQLELPDGAVVCVHAMLSGLGHLVGGPPVVFRALREAVRDCTIMMPNFPVAETMEKHLAADPVFDRDTTPSMSGLLSETLRHEPGALRGYHPTHACVALGPQSHALIDGTETADTPFGDNSTYGRFSARDDAYLLLLHTNNTSYVHRLQEIVDMPNLFRPGSRPAKWKDQNGEIRTTDVRVHYPRIPLFVILPGDTPDARQYVWFPDYACPFPDFNVERMEQVLPSRNAKEFLFGRQQELVDAGIMRVARVGNASILAIHVKPYTERMVADLRQSLSQFAADYDIEKLEAEQKQGLLRQL
ncbi:MAG: AAC(3) family N-acetyltransferase [Planctomycetota bacterium]|nr:AAC(3) family N-acetyltransferase [Planctomycetota bacterium]